MNVVRIMNGRLSARLTSTAVLGSVLLVASSCARETPGHCAFADGNTTCEEAFAGTFCIFQGPGFLDFAQEEYRNVSEAQRLGCYESPPMMDGPGGEQDMVGQYYGCVPTGLTNEDGLRGDLRALAKRKDDLTQFLAAHGVSDPMEGCPPDTGTTTDTSDSGTTTTGTDGSTTDGMSSESSTTGPIPCMGNDDCIELEAPQCVDGECMACVEGADGDAACAGVDAFTPLCAGGACVQCTAAVPQACTGDTPVCDDATNTCVPCTEHDQCASGACELAVGQCFPDATDVVHVDGDGGADFTSVTSAVGAVGNGARGIIVVHGQGAMGQTPYLGSVSVAGGKAIALLAAPGESPVILGDGGAPGVRASGAGTILYMDGLSVSGNTMGRGLRVDSEAFAWLDRSRIVQNSSGGIQVDSGAELTVRNCFVGSLGDVIGVEIVDSSASLLYSTITASTFGTTPVLSCTTPVAVDIRSSIIVSQGGTSPDEVSCADAAISNSATEVEVGAFSAGWFVGFNAGDYHLTASGIAAFADIAQWQAGDPATDIDGDLRPSVDDTADYPGADVP